MSIAVGMSGGLDSTIAAFLLKQSGADVVGLTMKIWAGSGQPDEIHRSGCYGPSEGLDIEDAQFACSKIGIPHHVVDLTREYSDTVLTNFSSEYLHGRTPNPCILCNPMIKFGAMLKKARESGIEFSHFATGHYARIVYDEISSRYLLKTGLDPLKDQSYFLYRLNQTQLQQIKFPLGEYTKKHVRKLAEENGFSEYADKPESQNFIDNGDYQSLFDKEKIRSGKIIDVHGNVLGEHRGIHRFTIGQRKGLHLGGLSEPVYVIDKNVENNTIIVGPKEYLKFTRLSASFLNWISIEKLEHPIRAFSRFRYNQLTAPCRIIPMDEKHVDVVFEQPHLAATPGQSIVFYQDEKVIGGGIIDIVQSLIKAGL